MITKHKNTKKHKKYKKTEAHAAHNFLLEKKRRMNAIQRAFERAQDELSSCLDLAGQVYMFGYGVTNQFNHGPALQEHSYIAPVARYRGANEFKRCMFRSIFVFLIFIKVLSILHTSTPLFFFFFYYRSI